MMGTRQEQDTATGWVCVDCLMLLANGETPPDMNEEETAAWLDSMGDEEVTLGLMREEHECDYDNDWHTGRCGCECRGFSWSRCDLCKRGAGERHAVTFWFDKEG